MVDFKQIGGATTTWGAQHSNSQRIQDAGLQQSEYKIGGRLGGNDIQIRTGARVTRARGFGVWLSRKGSGLRDAFVREKSHGIIPKSSDEAIRKKQLRTLRHAEHAFDKAANRLVEDLANRGDTMRPAEMAQKLVDIRKKAADLSAASKALGDEPVDGKQLMERLQRNLADSLTVVAKAQPEKAQVIRQQFEPGGHLAGLERNFGLLAANEDLHTKHEGALVAGALKNAVTDALGRRDDLHKLHEAGIQNIDDVSVSHALNHDEFPQLGKEFLAHATKEHSAHNVLADRLINRIIGSSGHIRTTPREHMPPIAGSVEGKYVEDLKSKLRQLRDDFLTNDRPNTINIDSGYRRNAIREINHYLEHGDNLQQLVNTLDSVRVDNRNRMTDTMDRFKLELEPRWGQPANLPGKQIGGPGNLRFSGPSDVSFEHRTTHILSTTMDRTENDDIAEHFYQDVDRNSKPALIDERGNRTILQPSNASNQDPGDQFKDFVNDDNANVAKNLSRYVNQDTVKNSIGLVTQNMKTHDGHTVLPSFNDQNIKYSVQKDGPDAFVVHYKGDFGVNVLVAQGAGMKTQTKMLDPDQNKLSMSMSIRLTRDDLAAGNGNFTYVDKPKWNATWQN